MNVLLNGACGRMGKSVIEVARRFYPDIRIIPVDIKKEEGIFDINDVSDFDCVIDFSSPCGFSSAIKHAVKFSKAFVSGTTGIGDDEKRIMKEASSKIAVFYSPNMSIGMNICFYIIDVISKRLRCDVWIKEVHHKFKKDKPSGTAIRIKDIIERNGLSVDISSLRAGDVVGEHEICFVMSEERINISHHALSREVFARGAIECAKWVVNKEKGLYDFYDMFGFAKV